MILLWLLGIVSSYTMGGLIHILLVIAIIVALVRIIWSEAVVGLSWRPSSACSPPKQPRYGWPGQTFSPGSYFFYNSGIFSCGCITMSGLHSTVLGGGASELIGQQEQRDRSPLTIGKKTILYLPEPGRVASILPFYPLHQVRSGPNR
jgi:hypothetical protein